MPLIIAIRNEDETIVASDTVADVFYPSASEYGPAIGLPNKVAILITGNLEAVRPAIEPAMARGSEDIGAAGIAQLISAALTLKLIPNLSAMTGRAEIIVAGIDPVRHTRKPGLYYFDSAKAFKLNIIDSNAVAAGATAALDGLLPSLRRDASHDALIAIIKEAYASTKMQWPSACANHLLIGSLSPDVMHYEVF